MNNSSTINIIDEGVREYYNEYQERMDLMTKVFLELYTVLSLLCIAVNIIIIFVTIRYRRLRHEKANVILLNWAILNTFFMLSQPISFRMSINWFFSSPLASTTFCVLEQTEYTALFGCVLLIMLLHLYWHLKVYHPRKCVKIANHMKLSIGSIYIFCTFALCFHLGKCFDVGYFFYIIGELSLILLYSVFIIFMIIMNIIHLVKRRKLISTTVVSNIPLLLSNTYFISLLPLLIFIIIQLIFWIESFTQIALICSGLILAVMNPLYFFFVLYKCDKDYRTFFGYVLRCQCNKYGNDEMEEDPVIFNGDVHIQNSSQ